MLSVCLSSFLIAIITPPYSATCTTNLPSSLPFYLAPGGGVLLLTRDPASQRFRLSQQPTIESFGVGISLVVPVNFRPRRLFPSRRFAVEFCSVFRKGESLELFWRNA